MLRPFTVAIERLCTERWEDLQLTEQLPLFCSHLALTVRQA